jgi:enoyl-CoA hydratase
MSGEAAPESPVLVSRRGGLGLLTLNRPRAINALTHEMVRTLQSALDAWAQDPTVDTVALIGAGKRGLCAGGDIVSIYRDAVSGSSDSVDFWRDEYVLNATIADYPKPYVAVMDGIVLGGGVGVSAHASHRVVTERTRIGMPEVGIGFVPDVGGTYLLSRSPGELGTYVALTAGHVAAADAIELRLADHLVDSSDVGALIELLVDYPADVAIAKVATPGAHAPLASDREWIDSAFAHDEVQEIVDALEQLDHDGARAALSALARHSPTSLAVTLRALRRARDLDLEQALAQELRIATRMLRGHDFPEGIRAQVIDKDRNPQWAPARITEVTPALVDSYFEPLGEGELVLPHPEGTA